MDIGTKISILDSLRKGEKIAMVARKFKVNESTVRSIRKNEEKIRKSAAQLGTHSKQCKISRGIVMEKMEDMLIIWMQDLIQRKVALSGAAIRTQALTYFHHLKKKDQSNSKEAFVASRGWFEKFIKRFSLHNVSFSGEIASADETAARDFPPVLRQFINEKGYLPAQIFNADETGLYWKKMPKRTYLTEQEKRAPGFKVSKDRYTLLFRANVLGTCKCKPMLVYRSENPRVLKQKRKEHLPVYWKSNKSAWVTKKNFQEWFCQSFVPEVEKFLRKQNLSFKALLLLDNAPGHPQELTLLHPNVDVLFFPPNTTSLIQPMDQTVIATFKSYYLRRVLHGMLEVVNHARSLEENPRSQVIQFWKKFTILDSIEAVEESWKEVKASTINKSWRKLLPEMVVQEVVEPSYEDCVKELLHIARSIGGEGFQDAQESDLLELIRTDTGLAIEEVEELVNRPEQEEEEEPSESSCFTDKSIVKIIKTIQEAVEEAVEHDPIVARSLKFKHDCNVALSSYQELYKDILRRSKQPLLTKYFNKIDENY